ncbi:RNA polymerase sigma factor [Agromyces rhizosphaerae]|uniref:RNA polymerase sigma factor n=1 Tax=Agromyces rhizosphaerae TaxID=88374 RepID=A0A9W6D0F2_9MICO|nr:sigma-70 family RNA polymerase sigma factor [Agromyces rhizosphaerae]GLI28537.1 RNA polymerase sigma factor [Agromyces rhizosphaerae]
MTAWDAEALRASIPGVVAILVRRGADFASAEDAVQTALVRALERTDPASVRDLRAWLVTTAWRAFLDQARSDAARSAREERIAAEPEPGPASHHDDTLRLYFLCAHPSLSPTSAIALTLRAIAGLTTRQIADAFLVPEPTMAQRISRAKQRLAGVPLDQPGDLSRVLRVLYLLFNEGYSGEIDLAVEAVRVTRQLALLTDEPEVRGLLSLMLLHHARRAARVVDGRLVPLAEQDRSRWDVEAIAEGIDILQAALARDRLGQYQAQAAIAALHADAPTAAETDWVQVVEWYDELVRLADSPVVRLGRAIAVGEAEGPRAGLAALEPLDPDLPRFHAARAYLLERTGDVEAAAAEYDEAARRATSSLEQEHLLRQAARLHAAREPDA